MRGNETPRSDAPADAPARVTCERAMDLLNRWQRDFPLIEAPFAEVGRAVGIAADEVIARYRGLLEAGALSRIGGVFGAGAGGAALLAAMAVPQRRLDEVAAIVSGHPGVNHNYEREHHYNLWFVMTGQHVEAVERSIAGLEAVTGLPALRLRMQRPYRIDLGFDLRRSTAALPPRPQRHAAAAVAPADHGLAALVEDGLPLVERPYAAWARALGRPQRAVLDTLGDWLRRGALRRFGTIVRHHELGFSANAMTVFDVPDTLVDGCGHALAQEPAVTLAYRRDRDREWRYNLYCMVHGRDRETVRAVLEGAIARCGLDQFPRAVLFSRRRFKQTGARRFRPLDGLDATHAGGVHAID